MARIVDIEAKRLLILEAAAACFAQSGYDDTSMNDVAAAAKVSKGSLYDYFKNKEDLFYAVFAWLQQQLMQSLLAETGTASSAQDRIVRTVDAAVAGLIQHISLYPVSLEVWAAAARTGTRERFAQAMRQSYTDYRREVIELIRSAQSTGELKADVDAEGLAAVLVGAVDGLLLQYWLDPSFDPRRVVRGFFSALFSGIGQS